MPSATPDRPSRRASQGRKVYRVADSSDEDDGDVVMASPKKTAPAKTPPAKPSRRGQADLRSFFSKRAKADTSDDDTPPTPTFSTGKIRVEAYVEVPARRGTPGSTTVASSVTRSPRRQKPVAKRRKTSHGSDSDSSFHIDADEVAALEAFDADVASDEVVDDASEVAAATPEPEEDEPDAIPVEEKPKKRAPRKSTGKAAGKGGVSAAQRKKLEAAAADAGNLPPMVELSDMFRDMITRKPNSATDAAADDVDEDEDVKPAKKEKKQSKLFAPHNKAEPEDVAAKYPEPKGVYLAEVAKKLGGRKLRVATMCSGTESPLLALGLISREMKAVHNVPFEVEHVFSCELEPFKQAYIERNFAPPILFRDVTELGRDQATTAYGALVDVPGNVDLLIAGTSCVDYSNLNNQKKDLDAKGESGNTFRGMISWVTKHRPGIVVLENVCGAPWDRVADHFENIGYSAIHTRFDTKDFYIPHTRSRGYLVAFRNPQAKGVDPADQPMAGATEQWVEMVKGMRRPASSPFEAFLLPANDPRLHQGRLELAAVRAMGKSRMPTDWGRCASRHEKCRFEEGLGTKRPYTEWRDGAICNMPEGYWNDWANAQTERVQDLIDVSHLRAARMGYDPAYRTLVWNLSQNVDREIGSAKRPGIVPCMTPTMIPYVTNRGGPLIGIEALALQGIPADELILTRETEDQLADLAGNAMSSTVVGVCMISALIIGAANLDLVEGADAHKASAELADAAVAATHDVADHIVGDSGLEEQPLDLASCGTTPVAKLLDDAAKSSRHCICEGPHSLAQSATLQCSVCGHTRCETCSDRPLHVYEPHPLAKDRVLPADFAQTLKGDLPMRLVLTGIDDQVLQTVKEQASIDADVWNIWSKAVLAGLDDAEFHYRSANRQHLWMISYEAAKAYLRLTLEADRLVWLLYCKAPAQDNVNAVRRKLLSQPVARMVVRRDAPSVLDGEWSVLLPSSHNAKITIEGKGELVPTWEARLGIVQKPEDQDSAAADTIDWQGKRQWTELEVKAQAEDAAKMDLDISGTYTLQPRCGTAMENLHIRDDGVLPKVSLFLDEVRCGFTKDDPLVFALDHERLDYGVDRLTVAKVDPSWRPASSEGPRTVAITVHGQWVDTAKLTLAKVDAAISMAQDAGAKVAATYGVPRSVTLNLANDACLHANAMLMCRVPLPHADSDRLWSSARDTWAEIDLKHKGKQAFESLAWITERLPRLTHMEQWSDVVSEHDLSCSRCAPARPELSWMIRGKKLVAVEDVVQAGEYERAMKGRPAPLVAQIRFQDGVGTLRIGLNIATLLHRAAANLPTKDRDQEIKLAWRLITTYQSVETAFFRPKKLYLTSNKKDVASAQPPNFTSIKLRPEQLRSLTWMLAQERVQDDHTFVEEEIAEATLGALGWRAEGRAARPVLVRGGVLADEVGYGKTAISLGLIDVARSLEPLNLPAKKGKIGVKGTLVVVPPHLTGQWEGEIKKFLGRGKHKYKVIKLYDMSSLNGTSVNDLMEADIVLVALSIFKVATYWTNLAGMSAAGTLPNGEQATRHFNARLVEVLAGLQEQVEVLQGEGGAAAADAAIQAAFKRTKEERRKAQEEKDAFMTMFGKKRLTGAAYLAMQEEDGQKSGKSKKVQSQKAEREHSDPWSLKSSATKKDWTNLRCPPLHMFSFERVIIDEFTYIDHRSHSAVTTLSANSTWVLSGTPPISDFTAVKGIAAFLHVHLGIDDDTEGTTGATKRLKGQTAAEAFHSFREVRTASWHAARYKVAQSFLDTFVRQNVAEIDEIPSSQHVISITLPAAEHAIYLELDHHINSLQGMTKKIMKSAKGAHADRQLRLADALGESADPREALIKRCAHFDMEAETDNVHNASEACQRIVDTRTAQRDACVEDLRYTLAEALELYLYIKVDRKGYSDPKLGPREHRTSHFAEYIKTTFETGNGDEEATRLHREVIKSEGCTWKNGTYVVDAKVHQAAVKARKPRETEEDPIKRVAKTPIDEFKWALREKSHVLRKLATELVGRTRSLRYFTAVRDVQRSGDSTIADCLKCGKNGKTGADMAILSACGHTGCRACLEPLARLGYECPHEGCRINLETHQVIPAGTLGREEKSGRFGAKLLQMVALIRSIPKGERILIFVQFNDLLEKIRSALRAARIGTIVIEGSAKKQSDLLTRFQNLSDGDEERVLVLNVAAASASGANLTLANHVIFVHPVHYPEVQNDRFIATETQAVGRIRRYGQKRPCRIYRLITQNSVDETIMVERTGSKPVGNMVVDVAAEDLEYDDDVEADSKPSKRKAAVAAASARRKKRKSTASDSDEEMELADESDTPEPPVKKTAKTASGRAKKAKVIEIDDSD